VKLYREIQQQAEADGRPAELPEAPQLTLSVMRTSHMPIDKRHVTIYD
jgi:hypothetical protein